MLFNRDISDFLRGKYLTFMLKKVIFNKYSKIGSCNRNKYSLKMRDFKLFYKVTNGDILEICSEVLHQFTK